MEKLWAPWRMEFLENPAKGLKSECIFCSFPKQNKDDEFLILHRAKKTFVIMNKYPYNNGHLMVIPYMHTSDPAALQGEVSNELMELSIKATEILKATYNAEGFNMGMNLGLAGGAGIQEHLHMHIVPRWLGDTNFLPVIAETKCMPQHLRTGYEKLQSAFKQI